MDISNMGLDFSRLSEDENTRVRLYLNKVYTWMAVALLVTALAIYYTMNSLSTYMWVCSGMGMFVCFGGTLVILLVMMFARDALTSGTLTVLFMVFSALEGLLLGPMLSMYTSQSLGAAFACAAGTFGIMFFWGATTKRNLSAMGRFLLMSLIGLIVCSVVNIFGGSSMLDFGICVVGVLIFSGLTAYDTQKLIIEGRVLEGSVRSKSAIFGALSLYLDFLNLFLYMLRLLGRRD